MNEYIVFWRFGSSHTTGGDTVYADSAKEAFKLAVIKYFDEGKYNKYTAFYVTSSNSELDDFERGYGYDSDGQKNFYGCGVRLAQKWIIDNILNDK